MHDTDQPGLTDSLFGITAHMFMRSILPRCVNSILQNDVPELILNMQLYRYQPLRLFLVFGMIVIANSAIAGSVNVESLRCEYLRSPLGIDVAEPRLSWQITDGPNVRGQKQTAYHVVVASRLDLLDDEQGDLWNSGKVSSSQSTLVPYQGVGLKSNQSCYWKVQVFDKDGQASDWSEPAHFTMGLLDPSDWKGPWITHPGMPSSDGAATMPGATELTVGSAETLSRSKHLWFRKNVRLKAPARNAIIHIASCGYHELYVNGKKADDRVLAPAQSRLDKRVLYVTYDVANLLQEGDNVIAFWTGPGWSRYAHFKTRQALRANLDGHDVAGNYFSLATGADWRCHASNSTNRGDIKYRDHGGEIIDAREFVEGWNSVGFDDRAWPFAVETAIDVELSAQMMEPTRIIETIAATSVSGDGPYRFDLGKNFTGWVEIKIRGQQVGDRIAIKVADDVDTVQDFGQLNEYYCKGGEVETFRNRFNYIAGRFVNIEGLRQRPELGDVTGLVLATDIKRVANFDCSKELFNQIYEADLWTYRANTVEGFTMDCPHRERLGYGEVAFATAWGIGLPNYRSGAFYMKHVRDWSDVQEDNGWIHHTAPQINDHYGGPMWSSAGLNIASAFYQTHGDDRIFERIYPAAVRWLEYLNNNVQDGILVRFTDHDGKFLGDWAAPKQRKEWGNTPEAQYFNNCVYAMNLADTVRMARVLGRTEDVARFENRLKGLRTAIHTRFFDPSTNRYSNGTQVQQAFALMTEITPPALRREVFSKIENDLTKPQPYLDMGSSGLPVLFKFMIEESGRSELFYDALSSKTQPSYGYFIERGESTWPEYWNVDVPSRIHTCYTGVASWMTKSLAGIRPDPAVPGFQSFIIQPVLAGDLTYAEASTESPYGVITSRWERDDTRIKLNVTIPPNSRATVHVPTSDPQSVSENGKSLGNIDGVKLLRIESGHAVLDVAAGNYQFTADR